MRTSDHNNAATCPRSCGSLGRILEDSLSTRFEVFESNFYGSGKGPWRAATIFRLFAKTLNIVRWNASFFKVCPSGRTTKSG